MDSEKNLIPIYRVEKFDTIIMNWILSHNKMSGLLPFVDLDPAPFSMLGVNYRKLLDQSVYGRDCRWSRHLQPSPDYLYNFIDFFGQ